VIERVFSGDPYLVLSEYAPNTKRSRVSVFDKKGDIVSKMDLPSGTVAIGLCSKKHTVYLLKDLRAIQECDFIGGGEIETIYRLW